MLRIRVFGALLGVAALLTAACGVSTTTSTGTEPEPAAVAGAEPAPTTSAALEEAPATSSAEAASDADADDAAADSDLDDGDLDDGVSTEDGEAAIPADVEALLASVASLDGRSGRGVMTIGIAPGLDLSASFEVDVEGDLAATVEIPPGLDPTVPAPPETEVRYVGGAVYARLPVPAETLADLGLDEAWYLEESVLGDDPVFSMGPIDGLMCMFPQLAETPMDTCDPLGEVEAFLDAVSEAEVVGREDVRGVEATRVRLLVSLRDLVGETLGIGPEEGNSDASEEGAFDATASDPFAEGLEQIFGFLSVGVEVEVWIDDDGLLRRFVFDLGALFANMAGDGMDEIEVPSSLITIEYYDYDTDISVDAPPPEVIVDISLIEELLGAAEGY